METSRRVLFQRMTALTDTLARPLRDLRISVTDRCNFRCTYCMPKEVFGRDYAFLPRDQLLSFEEIALRRDLDRLVKLGGIPGIRDLALTTRCDGCAGGMPRPGVRMPPAALPTPWIGLPRQPGL
jgi:hypothetical protein